MRLLCAIFALALLGCRPQDDRATLTAALARYERLATAMQVDSVSALYASDGAILGDGMAPVVGPQAIARFLYGFSDYHILRYTLKADTTWVVRDTGFQSGSFEQLVVVPHGDTVTAHGHLAIAWVRQPAGGWRIGWLRTSP
jgi:ketosteroid isomerase-like protein